jgi:hypothetical protein
MADQLQKQQQQQQQQHLLKHDKLKDDQQDVQVDDLGCVRDIELTDNHTLVGFASLTVPSSCHPCHSSVACCP